MGFVFVLMIVTAGTVAAAALGLNIGRDTRP